MTFLEEHRLFLFRHDNSFHAVEGICTHLGCTLKFSPFKEEKELTVRKIQYQSQGEFHCPCHGSRFRDEGNEFRGSGAPSAAVVSGGALAGRRSVGREHVRKRSIETSDWWFE